MTLETWVALGAGVLLTAAGVAQGSVLLKVGPRPGRRDQLAAGARLGGAAILTVAVILAAIAHGEWSPSDPRQVALDLTLAALVIHLVLGWQLGVGSAGPVVDVVALILVVVGAIAVWPGGPLLTCAQRAVPFWAQWALFLLGSGGVIVAGSAGLMEMIQAWMARRGRHLRLPRQADTHTLLRQATSLALVALGSGLAVSVWWAWQTAGLLTDGDPRAGWIAATWLAAAMSELAWWLDRRSPVSDQGDRAGQWAAGLAIAAAVVAILGLLAVVDLRHLLGTW